MDFKNTINNNVKQNATQNNINYYFNAAQENAIKIIILFLCGNSFKLKTIQEEQ